MGGSKSPADRFVLCSAVSMFGTKRLGALAWSVRYKLQRYPAVGAYELYSYATLWDEFCHWVQNAPDGVPSQSAWESSLEPFCSVIAEELDAEEAALLTVTAAKESGAFDDDDLGEPDVVANRRLIANAIRVRLDDLARERNIERFVPKVLR